MYDLCVMYVNTYIVCVCVCWIPPNVTRWCWCTDLSYFIHICHLSIVTIHYIKVSIILLNSLPWSFLQSKKKTHGRPIGLLWFNCSIIEWPEKKYNKRRKAVECIRKHSKKKKISMGIVTWKLSVLNKYLKWLRIVMLKRFVSPVNIHKSQAGELLEKWLKQCLKKLLIVALMKKVNIH